MNDTAGRGDIWTVTRVVRTLKLLLARELPPVWVEGEVSNYSHSSAGHRYFSLRDEENQLKAALFRGRSRSLRFEPADGMKVIAFGQIDIYGPRSEYQLIVDRLLPSGQGELELALKQLHARLAAEGLFDAARKRPLPRFPRRLGIVTSARGAAVRDILKVLQRRAPHVEVVIADVPVQGPQAAAQIAAGVARLGQLPGIDIVIVARGGGSLEDLWAFNEEAVVRSVVACPVPVVSGVGHEVDTTLCDLASDLRAPTPSAAAELAVRPGAEWIAVLSDLSRRLGSEANEAVVSRSESLRRLGRRYAFRRPGEALQTYQQRTDELSARLRRGLKRTARRSRERLAACWIRPGLNTPGIWIDRRAVDVGHSARRLLSSWPVKRAVTRERLARATGGLDALSPRAVLERGYAVLTDRDGHVVTSISQVSPEDRLRALLRDGALESVVISRQKGVRWP